MKRILHALAALWPVKTGDRRGKTKERRQEHEGPWLPEARNGLLQHLTAMMRMGETVRELATRECVHLPSGELANEQPSESANVQTNESIPKNTDNQLPKRVIVSERELPAERIGEPLPIAQVLARVYLRSATQCAMGEAEANDRRAKQFLWKVPRYIRSRQRTIPSNYFKRAYKTVFHVYETLRSAPCKWGLAMVLSCACGLSTMAVAQTYEAEGRVLSATEQSGYAKGQPVVGATVVNLRTKATTKTDAEGRFKLVALPDDRLAFTSVGFIAAEEYAGASGPITVLLQPSDRTLDEVVIIGYGQTSKRLNTGGVSSIGSKEIERQPVTNVLAALSGRMPGVFVQTANGLPGGNVNIQIRGRGSLTAGTQPLYIVDGVPIDGSVLNSNSFISVGSIVGATSPLNGLNPADIQSISVLKDADATAIYGSRGANGVILITTKRSAAGESRATVDISQGISQVANHPKLLDLGQYLEIRREAFANDGLEPSADPASPNYAPDLMLWPDSEGQDWSRFLFGETASMTNAQGGLTGGNANTTFRVDGHYRREGTVMRGDGLYSRSGLRMQVNHRKGKFYLDANGMYSADNNDIPNPSTGNYISLLLAPNYPLYLADGSYNWYSGRNPLAQLNARSKSITNNLVGNLGLGYRLSDHLDFRASLGYSDIFADQTQRFPSASMRPGAVNYTNFGESRRQSFIAEPQLTYALVRGSSKLDFLLGGTYQLATGQNKFVQAANFSSERLMENLASAGVLRSASTDYSTYKYTSGFFRVTYNIADKVVVNGTARRDGSSRFGENSQYGTFYALGAAWVFSGERWVADNLPFLSFGKVRASYGITGNDQIPNYQYMSTYSSGVIYQNSTTLRPARIANASIRWETTRKYEAALEVGVLSDRVLASVAYYDNASRDQLVNYTIPNLTGFSSYQANLPAIVRNSGWEIELSTQLVDNAVFSWSASFNMTRSENQLVSFEDFEKSSYRNIYEIGYDISRIYGYRIAGVDPETGVARYLDVNGEVGQPHFFHTLGKRTPQSYGGIATSLRFKRLQLDAFGQFSRQWMNGGIAYSPGVFIYNNYQTVLGRWQQHGDVTDVPKASTASDFYYSGSSANVFDVRYFRLKNVALSYTVMAKQTLVNVYARAHNLMTFWDRDLPLLDPESGAPTALASNIPPARTFVFGVQLTF